MNKFAIVPFDQNGYSTKTLIDIHFLFPSKQKKNIYSKIGTEYLFLFLLHSWI